MEEKPESCNVNFFKPKKGYMREEALLILFILVCWGAATFGFQFLLRILAETPQGEGILTRLTFFNLPFHYWFTAQFLPLWFILLCIIFNLYIDRLTERHSRRRDDGYGR